MQATDPRRALLQIGVPLLLLLCGSLLIGHSSTSVPATQGLGQPDGYEGLLKKALIACAYLAALAGIAWWLAHRKRSDRGTQQADPDAAIVVVQQLKATPQITLMIVETCGKKVLVASTARAISTTVLEVE